MKGKRCHIGKTQVTYLGHVFSGTGKVPDPQKVQAVKAWPTPTSVTDVRQFLGLASYYQRYISRFEDIAAPLHALTRKGASFAWTPECSEAFDTLKDSLFACLLLPSSVLPLTKAAASYQYVWYFNENLWLVISAR